MVSFTTTPPPAPAPLVVSRARPAFFAAAAGRCAGGSGSRGAGTTSSVLSNCRPTRPNHGRHQKIQVLVSAYLVASGPMTAAHWTNLSSPRISTGAS